MKKRVVKKDTSYVVLVGGSVALILFVLYFWNPAVCFNESCFVDYANACRSADISKSVSGFTVRFTANDCVLTKTVIDAPADRLGDEMLLMSMSCPFDRISVGDISSLSANLHLCDGELKEYLRRQF